MILDTVSKSLEVLLAGAPATAQPIWTVAWADHTPTSLTPGSADGLTNGATAVTAVSAPASGVQRQIKFFSVFNNDTAAVVVTVRINNNGTFRTIVKITLAVGDTLEYDPANGWKVITSGGFLKTGIAPAGNTGEAQFNAGGGLLGASVNFIWDIINNKLKLGDGSAAHPSYTFVNSPTTGLFRQAADVIGVAIAGIEKLRLSATTLLSTNTAFDFTAGAIVRVGTTDAFDLILKRNNVDRISLTATSINLSQDIVALNGSAASWGTADAFDFSLRRNNVNKLVLAATEIILSSDGGDVKWGKPLVALGGGAVPTFGTIGGSGPATAAQNTWMRVIDSTGAAFWVPAWK